MIKTILLAIADYASPGHADKLNIMGIFDNIRFAKFPISQDQMYIVARFLIDSTEFNTEHSFCFKLTDENDGSVLIRIDNKVEIGEQAKKGSDFLTLNSVVALRNIEFKHPGKYTISIFIDDNIDMSIPLTIALLQPQESLERAD